jgi:hypothetical protein
MIVTAWNNGAHHAGGTGYSVSLNTNRQDHAVSNV